MHIIGFGQQQEFTTDDRY